MDVIHLTETDDTPEIILDDNSNQFEFRGISVMEDSVAFYSPVLDWIKTYSRNPNPETVVNFHMEYCNTSSSKQIYEIIIRFVNVEILGKKLVINWYYNSYDDDIRDLGNSFRKAAYDGINVLPEPKA